MSLALTCCWTMVRSVVLCLLAWPVCRIIARCLANVDDTNQFRPMCCLLVPICFPELLVGYSIRDFALTSPACAELLCAVFLFVRIIPIGTIALLAAPRPEFGAAAIHCRRLAMGIRQNEVPTFERHIRQWVELTRCYWNDSLVSALPALSLMCIVAFQEFEIAALVQSISWTDWFVMAQKTGLNQTEMIIQAFWPLAWQLPILIGVVGWIRNSNDQRNEPRLDDQSAEQLFGRNELRAGLISIAILIIVGCLIPAGLIAWQTRDGFSLLLRQPHQRTGLIREVVISGCVALCAGCTAWGLSGRTRSVAANFAIPGLFGSLLISLGCVALFQQPWLRPIYDTPLPWVLALLVWLMPRATILRLWLHVLRNDETSHVAQLMRYGRNRRQLLWRLRDQPRFLAVSLLCYWAYCDLPTSYLLAPTGMASGIVRLYNFMHFGRSAALSAEAFVFFGVPVLLVAILVGFNRLRTQGAR